MGKRADGEGSISRRKDGLYRTRYTVETDGSEEEDGIREKETRKACPRS